MHGAVTEAVVNGFRCGHADSSDSSHRAIRFPHPLGQLRYEFTQLLTLFRIAQLISIIERICAARHQKCLFVYVRPQVREDLAQVWQSPGASTGTRR